MNIFLQYRNPLNLSYEIVNGLSLDIDIWADLLFRHEIHNCAGNWKQLLVVKIVMLLNFGIFRVGKPLSLVNHAENNILET